MVAKRISGSTTTFALILVAAGACSAQIGAGTVDAGVGSGVGGRGGQGAGPSSPGDPTCQQPALGRRQLRLLTRREYRNTVRDLFAALAVTPAPGSPTASACAHHTFLYDPAGRALTSVFVSGDFNQWAKSISTGGWPLSYDAGRKLWSVQRPFQAGTFAYKFVLDEKEWVIDPANRDLTPDGYGGNNSLLKIVCTPAVSPVLDPTVTFPVESKPRQDNLSDLFPFDDSTLQVASLTHIEEYWQAASTITETVGSALDRLVPCSPVSSAPCLDSFVRTFGRRVFRRPLTPTEVTRYAKLAASSAAGRAAVVRAFLSSPHFLYRAEGSQPAADGTFRLTGYEVAGALSYLLWGSTPDSALLDSAASGGLDSTAGIETEARRLLVDFRARETIGEFASQWLGTDEILSADKERGRFPAFTGNVRASLNEETRRLVSHVVFDSGSAYRELLLADYSIVDGTLASFYGMPGGALTTGFAKKAYADSRRSGLLGHGSLLGVYARSDQTSPIKRGWFVRRRLLCQDLPPPPADVPPVPDVDPNATTRERFRQHTSEPRCASCHQLIDDIGFGFEHFDAVGQYRDTENHQPIDSRGDMNRLEGLDQDTHAPFATLPELARILAQSQAAPACFATQYLRFARGTFESDKTDCAGKAVQRRFRDSGYDIRELMVAATLATDFVHRR